MRIQENILPIYILSDTTEANPSTYHTCWPITLWMCSYHTSTNQSSMRKYRIGKLVEPWINKTPPIRGGIFPDPDASPEVCLDHPEVSTNVPSKDISQRGTPTESPTKAATTARDVLREKIIQSEVDYNVDNFPSLDLDTQSGIEAKYRDLHVQVLRGGFYKCQYIQYVKEISRYSAIFGLFLLTLTNGWYLTSAALLGLFWVSKFVSKHDHTDRCSTKSCLLLTTLDIVA